MINVILSYLAAVLKSQTEKSGPSLAGVDLDKNIKLYHSKSLSEIPHVGLSEEGKEGRKVFEKRWSSSAIDLNMAQTIMQVCELSSYTLDIRIFQFHSMVLFCHGGLFNVFSPHKSLFIRFIECLEANYLLLQTNESYLSNL